MTSESPMKARAAKRIPSRESVSIQILLPDLDLPETPRVVCGTTTDVSANGLRVLLSEPIEAERVFDLCVELDFNPRYFLLVGETRWCHQCHDNQTNEYEVGILIHDSEGTDYDAWTKLFADI